MCIINTSDFIGLVKSDINKENFTARKESFLIDELLKSPMLWMKGLVAGNVRPATDRLMKT